MSSQSLKKLRQLTQDLCRRDEDKARELQLYDAFFSNIPLCTFVWTVNPDFTIVVKNRKSLCSSSSLISNGTLFDAFSCEQMNERNVEMHKKAFGGEHQTYLSYEQENSFLTTLVPEQVGDNIAFVHGCSWEITHLQKMINCSVDAVEALEQTHPALAEKMQGVYDDAPLVQLVLKLKGDE